MSDNFNYICADCGPHEGDPFVTTPSHEEFCEACWKSRQENTTEEKYEDEQWKAEKQAGLPMSILMILGML